MSRVPKSAQDMVATLVRSIFAQPDAEAAWAQPGRVCIQLQQRFPAAAELLIGAAEEVLAYTGFPKEHWRQIWSNNPQERLNKEVRRRTDVVGIFPNRAGVIRLVGAVLAEQNDEWIEAERRYTGALVEGSLICGPAVRDADEPHRPGAPHRHDSVYVDNLARVEACDLRSPPATVTAHFAITLVAPG